MEKQLQKTSAEAKNGHHLAVQGMHLFSQVEKNILQKKTDIKTGHDSKSLMHDLPTHWEKPSQPHVDKAQETLAEPNLATEQSIIGTRLSMATPFFGQPSYIKSEEFSDDESEHGKPRRGQCRTDPYATRELCKSVLGTPTWDGQSLNWKSFLKEWKVY